jgi:prepilin-type N-terminal cleavage/methylation domain-containing protein
MTSRMRSDRGFTLVEMLVATAIMLLTTGAVFTLLNPTSGMFQTQPEVSDIQQRLRVGVDTLSHDLMMAGAGAYSGALSGNLGGFFAPIQPSRQGNLSQYDDGPGVFFPDRITLFYVPSTASQTSISQGMPNVSAELKVNPEPGCPAGSDLCGFKEGMNVLIYDDTGAYDSMTITNVQESACHLQHNQQGDLSKSYSVGAKVAQVDQHIYYYNAPTLQLMHYDGFQTVLPVLDNVVGLDFEYYGEPTPPQMKNPGVDQTTTYGPKPPALGVSQTGWPAGENCTILVSSGQQVPRLATLGAPGSGLVQLTASQLTDGPWCPNSTNSNRFDADLLRIRKIRVSIRLQTGNPALRGSLTTGPDALFTNAGTSTGVYRVVPDQMIRFDVTPRNMNLGR